ncbi:type II toxin-antitoxin system RelE family toxin [Campylobacter helveticus]|uniref:Type II toxin-antitoxin system RelE/ParE family toxin n=1 Tax=Campylobacter helveticus TaxID=28898 RepID=A0AAX2UKW3_9BACT|nr:type II toxin-antitoxin system RelE/ParE family toxin [Campylobacter helveticus]ARE81381.1 toxin-antitoxin system, toxin, mRNA-degrading endonuclease RelE [Campylobacter helveticus]MCR2064599.1 type II toxin-antitoxin system RelE/ParE family toxin [Campylobacter helveticus]TNB57675.1 type II toxin-antitoxin system RelE/ParE family toxin [Campylobacter helveticus]TXK56446.1 type II toxin-antitoxin system RelE/ParE family toxin [Campylobacter helveticus]SMC22262.1 mRNA interferase RelE/StbE [
MKYEVRTSKEFDKFLAKHNNLAPKILNTLEILAQNPYENAFDIKKLQGKDKHYRLRLGKYRILYELMENRLLIIYVYRADSRGDIYKA